MHERIGDLFATIDRRNHNEESTAGDNESKLTIADVAFVICKNVSSARPPEISAHTSQSLFDLIQYEIHQLVIALQCSNDCDQS